MTQLLLVAQEEWCAARIAAGATVETVADVEGLVQREPVRERRWALLMEALDAHRTTCGSRADLSIGRGGCSPRNGGSRPATNSPRLQEALLRADTPPDTTTGRERRSEVVRTARSVAAPLSTLIGRDAFVDDVRRACARWHRVTLTGVGGVGKSQVALAVTNPVPSSYPGGCWFVGLVTADRTDTDIDLACGRNQSLR